MWAFHCLALSLLGWVLARAAPLHLLGHRHFPLILPIFANTSLMKHSSLIPIWAVSPGYLLDPQEKRALQSQSNSETWVNSSSALASNAAHYLAPSGNARGHMLSMTAGLDGWNEGEKMGRWIPIGISHSWGCKHPKMLVQLPFCEGCTRTPACRTPKRNTKWELKATIITGFENKTRAGISPYLPPISWLRQRADLGRRGVFLRLSDTRGHFSILSIRRCIQELE